MSDQVQQDVNDSKELAEVQEPVNPIYSDYKWEKGVSAHTSIPKAIDRWIHSTRSKLRLDYRAIFDIMSDPKHAYYKENQVAELARKRLVEICEWYNENNPEKPHMRMGEPDEKPGLYESRWENVQHYISTASIIEFKKKLPQRTSVMAALNVRANRHFIGSKFIYYMTKAFEAAERRMEKDNDVNHFARLVELCMKYNKDVERITDIQIDNKFMRKVEKHEKILAGLQSASTRRGIKYEEKSRSMTVYEDDETNTVNTMADVIENTEQYANGDDSEDDDE